MLVQRWLLSQTQVFMNGMEFWRLSRGRSETKHAPSPWHIVQKIVFCRGEDKSDQSQFGAYMALRFFDCAP